MTIKQSIRIWREDIAGFNNRIYKDIKYYNIKDF
jgi:hypothetical protein